MKLVFAKETYKVVIKAISTLGLVAICNLCHAQDTGAQVSTAPIDININIVQYGSGNFYIRAQAQSIGTSACPNVDYLYISQSDPDYQMITKLALLAKASSKKMSFMGFCQTGNAYFRMTYAIAY